MKFEPKKIALVYMAHDGITSYYAGIGTYSLCYLDSLPKIIDQLHGAGIEVDLFLVTPSYQKAFYGFNDQQRLKSLETTQKYNGRIIEIDNGLDGLDSYGDISNWELASENGASVIEELAQGYEQVLAICVDTPFLKVPLYIDPKIANIPDRVKVALSPQSTESIHKSGIPDRMEWEMDIFNTVKTLPWAKVSYASLYIRSDLMSAYGLGEGDLVPSMSGLIIDNERYKTISQHDIAQKLKEAGIPTDRPLVVSVGRMERYKGFTEVLKMTACIPKEHRPYFVILGISYIKDNPLLTELQELQRNLGVEGKFIFELDLALPLSLWQWKNTKIAAQISEFEPFGLVSAEVKLLAKEHGPVMLTSERGGLYEQINEGYSGFRVNYGDEDSYRRAMTTIFSLPPTDIDDIRQHAAFDIHDRYDAQKNITEFLVALEPQLKHHLQK